MVRLALECRFTDVEPGRADERRELRDGHLEPTDVERRQAHRALRRCGRPPLVLKRLPVGRRVATHLERPFGNFHETEQLVVREIPDVWLETREIGRCSPRRNRGPRSGQDTGRGELHVHPPGDAQDQRRQDRETHD